MIGNIDSLIDVDSNIKRRVRFVDDNIIAVK